MRARFLLPAALLGTLAAACGGQAQADQAPATPPATAEVFVVPQAVPTVDVRRHSVPLDRIVFDTFRPIDRAVPLTEASPGLIASLLDAIPPIHRPVYEPAAEAAWLSEQDLVIGYAAGGSAWAYPLRILNFHELVNDELAGEPILVSYCPLCYSGVVYSRRLGGRVLRFGNTSALYESDLVMVDYQTGSYWWQVAGEAIVGPLTGARLQPLPSLTTTWGQWRDLHPQTLVLSRRTGYNRDYDRDPFRGYQDFVDQGAFLFPVSEAGMDPRLSPGARVLVLEVGGEVRAYPLEALAPGVVEDRVGGEEVVVFLVEEGPSGAAFRPLVEGMRLSFMWEDGVFVDRETGSAWDLTGRAIDGPLRGAQLEALPTKTSFWFAVVAAVPHIEVFVP